MRRCSSVSIGMTYHPIANGHTAVPEAWPQPGQAVRKLCRRLRAEASVAMRSSGGRLTSLGCRQSAMTTRRRKGGRTPRPPPLPWRGGPLWGSKGQAPRQLHGVCWLMTSSRQEPAVSEPLVDAWIATWRVWIASAPAYPVALCRRAETDVTGGDENYSVARRVKQLWPADGCKTASAMLRRAIGSAGWRLECPLPQGGANDGGSDSRVPGGQAYPRHVRRRWCSHRKVRTKRWRCPWQPKTTRLLGRESPRRRAHGLRPSSEAPRHLSYAPHHQDRR